MLVKTGYEVLDFYTGGFTKGNVITIDGDSGHLKTTIAIDMAFRMLDEDPKLRIGIFSKEMLCEELMRKIICRQCRLSMKEVLSRQYSKAEVRKIVAEYEPIASGRLSLVDPYNFSGVSDIAKIQFVHKFDVWFLDFIQLLEFGGGNSSSDVNVSIMQNMKQLKNLSVNTKTLGIVLSQIKKGVELRRTKIPTVNDLEWSGTIKQLSSYVLISYFPIKYYKNQVIPGVGTLPKDLYYLLGEKTRFADDLVLPMKVHAEYGLFEEYLDLSQRVQKTNILSFL
jgi:replicative DNA helicase